MFSNCTDFDEEILKMFTELFLIQIRKSMMITAPDISAGKRNLKTLDLSHNLIESLPDDYFVNCIKLQKVRLEHNNLLQIPNFEPIRETLIYMYLSKNSITDCGKFCHQEFPKIREVFLSANRIKAFDFKAISQWPSLRDIYLTKNQMKTIPDLTEMSRNSSLEEIQLFIRENPLVCDKRNAWIAEKYRKKVSKSRDSFSGVPFIQHTSPLLNYAISFRNQTTVCCMGPSKFCIWMRAIRSVIRRFI